MLCYVTPKEQPGLCRIMKTFKQGVDRQDRGVTLPTLARHRQGARASEDDALSAALDFGFDWNEQFRLVARSRNSSRRPTDETLPQDTFKTPHFCSMCGPKYCSMRDHRRHSQNGSRRLITMPVLDERVENGNHSTHKSSQQPALSNVHCSDNAPWSIELCYERPTDATCDDWLYSVFAIHNRNYVS